MYRVETTLRSYEVMQLATKMGAHTVSVTTYCQHERARYCKRCDYGDSDDHHMFIKPRGEVAHSERLDCDLVGLSDDGEWARYIPKRYQAHVDAYDRELARNYERSN